MMEEEQEDWGCHPEAEALLEDFLTTTKAKNTQIAELEQRLAAETSTRLFDWVDHIIIGASHPKLDQLLGSGFIKRFEEGTYHVLHHPGAIFPDVVVMNWGEELQGVVLSVDNITDFLMVRGYAGMILGTPLSPLRRCRINTENGISLHVVERRGSLSMDPIDAGDDFPAKVLTAMEHWQNIFRASDDEDTVMAEIQAVAEELIETLGRDYAAWLILECERQRWQAGNHGAQVQKGRQDRLGMGWANHDHHTFRSSRRHFPALIRLFETLGFHCRERFYAGEQAGWGAQVMENPSCKAVLFLDLDLAPGEIDGDFAHKSLGEKDSLGTVGLWCALHGDSILAAGMHHLEAQFLFDNLTEQLHELGVGMMEPFSTFSYLKQAFTHGEVWKVRPEKVQRLLDAEKITQEEAERFFQYGAVGSHLENLQRREGYKGFNKENVSFILKKVDPRHI